MPEPISVSPVAVAQSHSSLAQPAATAAVDTSPAAAVTVITYSSSYTIVPTYECYNSCSYCNFRTNVLADESAMLTLDSA